MSTSLTPMTALVTGASSGIGLEFSRQLAAMGHNIVLVSNQAEALERTCEELVDTYPRQRFLSYCLDLTVPNAADTLYEYCEREGIEVSILVNNAGIFSFCSVLDTSPHTLNLYVDLHMRAVTQLCHRFGHAMSCRHCGYILNMSSMSCWMPMPGIALYAATKAYIRVFSRALALELADEGVSVTVACPGGIATDLFGLPPHLQRLGVRLGALATPQKFVRGALRRMFKGKTQYVNGLLNRLAVCLVPRLPECVAKTVKHRLLDR